MTSSVTFSLCCFILYFHSPLVQGGGIRTTGRTAKENLDDCKGIKAANGKPLFEENCIQNIFSQSWLTNHVSVMEFEIKPGFTVIAFLGEGKKGIAALIALLKRHEKGEHLYIVHVCKDPRKDTAERRSESRAVRASDTTAEPKSATTDTSTPDLVKVELATMFNNLLNAMKKLPNVTVFPIEYDASKSIVEEALAELKKINNKYFSTDGIGNLPVGGASDDSKLYALDIRNQLETEQKVPGFAVNGSSFFEMQYYEKSKEPQTETNAAKLQIFEANEKRREDQKIYARKAQTALMLNGLNGDQKRVEASCDKLYVGMESQLYKFIKDKKADDTMSHTLIVVKFNENNDKEAGKSWDLTTFNSVDSVLAALGWFTEDTSIV